MDKVHESQPKVTSTSGGPTRRPRPSWLRAAGLLETAGFVAAAGAYLLPFLAVTTLYKGSLLVPGLELAIRSLGYLASEPWPYGLVFFGAFTLPLLVSLAGFTLTRRRGSRVALARLIFAVAGLSALSLGYLAETRPDLAFGYYLAGGALLVATVASALRLAAVLRFGEDQRHQGTTEPASSASQQLFQKRSRW